MIKKGLLFLLFILFDLTLCFSQKLSPPAIDDSGIPQKFRLINKESGLPSDICRDAVQDFQGYIWLASENGLAKYDGRNFTVFKAKTGDPFSIVNNSVRCLLQARDSMLWIGTYSGISIYNPFTGTFSNYPYDTGKKNGFPCGIVSFIYQDRADNIWISTDCGMVYVKKGSRNFVKYSYKRSENAKERGYYFDIMRGIVERPGDTNSLWVATYGGIININRGNGKLIKEWLNPIKDGFETTCIYADKTGKIWSGGWGIKLSCLDPSTGNWSSFSPDKPRLTNLIAISGDGEGRLFIGTAESGLAIYDLPTKKYRLISLDGENPLTSRLGGVNCIRQFNAGREIWALTTQGIAIEDRSYHSFKYTQVPFHYGIHTVFYDEKEGLMYAGGIWCNGLYILNEKLKQWKEVRPDIKIGKDLFCTKQILKDKKGEIWVGTRQGLMVLDQKKASLHYINSIHDKALIVKDSSISCLYEDRNRNLWVGTSFEGLYCINAERSDVRFFRNYTDEHHNVIAWKTIKALQEDRQGCIWIATSEGVLVYNPLKNTFDETVNDSLKRHGLFNKSIYSIVEDKQQRLWMSIDHFGLMCISILDTKPYNFSFYSTDDLGLENSSITYLAPDRKGGFWINNINLVHFNPADFSLRTYTEKNGLQYSMGDATRPCTDSNGTLYIPAEQGFESNISETDPGSYGIQKLVIEYFIVKGKHLPLGILHGNETIKLSADQTDITLGFSAICFQNFGSIGYSYFLQGYDHEWSNSRTNREARYTNLPPGNYQFIVRASYQGINNIKEARIRFVIPRHYWESWWFILLVILFVLSVFYLISRYRLEQMLKLERLRTRIATDLHDEVASTLSGISIMSEILGKEMKEARPARMINEIGSKSKNMLEMIDDIIWVVKPSNDHFQNLGLRIREFATPLFESRGIEYSFQLDENLSAMHLSMEMRRNIYLIAKEAINNLVKYSDCSQAGLIFAIKGQELRMDVMDNGKGFDPEQPTSRNGIKNMRQRASQIGAEFQILSSYGNGTHIKLLVKIS